MIFYIRPLLAVSFIAFLFTSCYNDKPEEKPDPIQQGKDLVAAHFRMLNDHDLKGLTAQYQDKASIMTSDWDGEAFGPAGADQIFHQTFYVSPDAKYLVDNVIVNDSTAVVEYDVVGLHEQYNSPIRYNLRNCSIFKFKTNKIISEATYSNTRIYHTK